MTMRFAALLLASIVCTSFLATNPACGLGVRYQDLLKLISDNEDLYITPEDLAFVLVTHNFDATPESGWIKVVIGNDTYKLVPNGNKPGLVHIHRA